MHGVRVAEADHHVVENAVRILGARIVGGRHHHVRSGLRHLRHLRPLATVAVASAAEDDDRPRRIVNPRRRQHHPQAVRRMRVVHQHHRRIGHALHPAGHTGQSMHGLHHVGERHEAQSAADGEYRRGVVDGERAEEPRQLERGTAPRRRPHSANAVRVVGQTFPTHVSAVPDRDRFASRRHGVQDGLAERVVDVDHGDAQVALEEPSLRRAVAGHRAVVVQMVAAQVREHADREIHRVHAPLVEGMGTRLHRHEPMASLAQRAQPGVQRDRVGGGQFGRAETRWPPPPQRAQIGFLGDQRDVVGDGGLAVGAGNADHVQFRTRHIVEAPRPRAEAPGHAVHDDVWNADVQRAFGDHGHGPRGHRVRREVVAVEGSAQVGEEDVARPHATRVARQPGNGQARRGLLAEQLAQRHGAFGAHAAIADDCSALGATPRMRRARAATCPNTGAATSPPPIKPRRG